MNDLQITSGALIDTCRRTPIHCLYCPKTTLTKEHVIPEAIGGRLTAHILCESHNGIVNGGADEPLSKNFAPFVNMLQTPRHRGEVGAEFVGTDIDGSPVTIVAEGFAKQAPLIVKKRDERRRIAYAEGALAHLDELPKEALSEDVQHVVIAKITLPDVDFAVASDRTILPGLLKIALHFYAGFAGDVSLQTAGTLLPYVRGERPPTGDMVRTPFLDEEVFPDSWPPRHEVTCYPNGDHALITILLFSAYAYSCRLPLTVSGNFGTRYTQVLTENYPTFVDTVPIPSTLDWEKRPGPGDHKAWSDPMEPRVRRIFEHGVESAIRSRCKRAFDRALSESSNLGNLWERYKAALQLECFTTAAINTIVTIGQALQRQGKAAWEVPVSVSQPAKEKGALGITAGS